LTNLPIVTLAFFIWSAPSFGCVEMSTEPRHFHGFAITPPTSTLAREIWPDKQALRDRIAELRAEGLSFRRISALIGLHWTRVAQILNGK
jgi:hypothetical protein